MIKETDPNYKEILFLNSLLADAGIPHNIYKHFDGWRISYQGKCGLHKNVSENLANPSAVFDLLEIEDEFGVIEKKNLIAEEALTIILKDIKEAKATEIEVELPALKEQGLKELFRLIKDESGEYGGYIPDYLPRKDKATAWEEKKS